MEFCIGSVDDGSSSGLFVSSLEYVTRKYQQLSRQIIHKQEEGIVSKYKQIASVGDHLLRVATVIFLGDWINLIYSFGII